MRTRSGLVYNRSIKPPVEFNQISNNIITQKNKTSATHHVDVTFPRPRKLPRRTAVAIIDDPCITTLIRTINGQLQTPYHNRADRNHRSSTTAGINTCSTAAATSPDCPHDRKRKRQISFLNYSINHDDDRSAKHNKYISRISPYSIDQLPDDILLSIFVCISSRAAKPSDLLSAAQTCKKFRRLGQHPLVLAHASLGCVANIKASSWCPASRRFLRRCSAAGNHQASYTLGMISFYCEDGGEEEGLVLMKTAARDGRHASALHSLAVIEFNGSGGAGSSDNPAARKPKNLEAGVSLCLRAASLGHISAMRELGHCLQDGYGVARNVVEGRRLLLEANAREAAEALMHQYATSANPRLPPVADVAALQIMATKIAIGCFQHLAAPPKATSSSSSVPAPAPLFKLLNSGGCSLLSDFGCNVPPPKLHPAHRFLVEWFSIRPPPPGLRLCSHALCGRPETRPHEFRRCSACGSVNYCSRACQALDWKLKHKFVCVPVANWQHQHRHGHAPPVQPGGAPPVAAAPHDNTQNRA